VGRRAGEVVMPDWYTDLLIIFIFVVIPVLFVVAVVT
jgi:hypothetical protein